SETRNAVRAASAIPIPQAVSTTECLPALTATVKVMPCITKSAAAVTSSVLAVTSDRTYAAARRPVLAGGTGARLGSVVLAGRTGWLRRVHERPRRRAGAAARTRVPEPRPAGAAPWPASGF